MPNENPTIPNEPAKVAEQNAQLARQVAEQGKLDRLSAQEDLADTTGALDKLAAQVQPKDEKSATPPPDKPVEGTPAKGEGTPAEPTPEEKAKAEEAAARRQRADDLFKDSPQLSANVSPKSSAAFSAIKEKAAQLIGEREAEIEKLKTQLEDLKKPSAEITALKKESEELRQWRARVDVEFDPKFKEFDKTIEGHREFIYDQLLKNPQITPEIIEQIKKHGGPDMVKMDKLFESLKDPTLQRIVDSKIANIEELKYQKKQAVQSAKDNIQRYMQERQTAATREAETSNQVLVKNLEENFRALSWFTEKQIDPKGTEQDKKSAEDHNKFLAELKPQIVEAIKDNSPEMRSTLITGMAQLFYLQRQVPILEKQIEALTADRDAIKAKWEAVKNASRSRLNESGAPPSGELPKPKPGIDVNMRAADALDNIAREMMEKKSAAANR